MSEPTKEEISKVMEWIANKPAETPPAVEIVIPPMPAAIAAAVTQVMAKIGIVEKRGYNKEHSYFFAAIGDVLQEVKPAMAEAGLIIIQEEGAMTLKSNDTMLWVTYAFSLHHSSGVAWQHKIPQTGVARHGFRSGGIDDKALNKCHSAARKYFMLALFQIPTDDIPEADQDGEERPARQVEHATLRREGTEPMENSGPPIEAPQSANGEAERQRTLGRLWLKNAKLEIGDCGSEESLGTWEKKHAGTIVKLRGVDEKMHRELLTTIQDRYLMLGQPR
jgi:hypothetical protein